MEIKQKKPVLLKKMATRGPRIQALWHLPWLVFLFSTTRVFCASTSKVPRLGVHGPYGARNHHGKVKVQSLAPSDQEFRTFYYNQTLDHFNYRPESYKTFQHRYVVSFKYWRGPDTMAPIFVYLGEESSLNDDLGYIGILSDNAARFGALQVYIEVSRIIIFSGEFDLFFLLKCSFFGFRD
jgi:lysosomal Pro-X carboxypeptidase